MRKRIICLALSFIMLLSVSVTVSAAERDITPQTAADRLNYYGLFNGSDIGYELERAPTRLEALAMLVRLMGHEEYARTAEWSHDERHPFKDVPTWGESYVQWGYSVGMVNGMSDNLFGSSEIVSAAQFTTMILRALGCDDGYGVFVWNNPWLISDEIGLTFGEYSTTKQFTRGDVAILAYRALSRHTTFDNNSLIYELALMGAIAEDKRAEAYAEFGRETHPIGIDALGRYLDIPRNNSVFVDIFGYQSFSGRLSATSGNEDIAKVTVGAAYYGEMAQSSIYVTANSPGKTYIKLVFDGDERATTYINVQVK